MPGLKSHRCISPVKLVCPSSCEALKACQPFGVNHARRVRPKFAPFTASTCLKISRVNCRGVQDPSQGQATITVFKSSQTTVSHFHTGDVVRIRGSVILEDAQVDTVAVRLDEVATTAAIVACPQMQIRTITSRRLAQSSGTPTPRHSGARSWSAV